MHPNSLCPKLGLSTDPQATNEDAQEVEPGPCPAGFSTPETRGSQRTGSPEEEGPQQNLACRWAVRASLSSLLEWTPHVSLSV